MIWINNNAYRDEAGQGYPPVPAFFQAMQVYIIRFYLFCPTEVGKYSNVFSVAFFSRNIEQAGNGT